jgi:hypothetical protein
MSEPEKGNDSLWHDIGDRGALQKVMGSLRQRKPKSDAGFASTFQQTAKQSQHAGNESSSASQSTTDLNPYSNWQQTFSNVANTAPRPQGGSPQLMNNMIISVPSAPYQPPLDMAYTMPFAHVFASPPTQNSQTPIVVSEDETTGSETNAAASSECHSHNPSFTLSSDGSEEVPLAAFLTSNIFDEDLQLGIPLFGDGNSNLWRLSEIGFLASQAGTSIGPQDAQLNLLLSKETRDLFSL